MVPSRLNVGDSPNLVRFRRTFVLKGKSPTETQRREIFYYETVIDVPSFANFASLLLSKQTYKRRRPTTDVGGGRRAGAPRADNAGIVGRAPLLTQSRPRLKRTPVAKRAPQPCAPAMRRKLPLSPPPPRARPLSLGRRSLALDGHAPQRAQNRRQRYRPFG